MSNIMMMKDARMLRSEQKQYQKYGMVYSEQCTKCLKEGTHFCELKFTDAGECLNFKTLDDLKEEYNNS